MFSGPDAQIVGATLNAAGGGDMFTRSKREDELARQIDVMREAAARLKPLARDAIASPDDAPTGHTEALYEAIAWVAKGCPAEDAKVCDGEFAGPNACNCGDPARHF